MQSKFLFLALAIIIVSSFASSLPATDNIYTFDTSYGKVFEVDDDLLSGFLWDDNETSCPSSITISKNTSHGNLSVGSCGGFTYTVSDSFSGVDYFTYSFNDSLEADVLIGVDNDAPEALPDFYFMTDAFLEIAAPGILGNDSDANSDDIYSVLVQNTSHGNLTLNNNGSFSYNSTKLTGIDYFTYQATDRHSSSPTAEVILLINNNTFPLGVKDFYNVSLNGELNINETSFGVLANDTDSDNDSLKAVKTENVKNGTLLLYSDGTFDYTPDSGFTGVDSFKYIASDRNLNSSEILVRLYVGLNESIIPLEVANITLSPSLPLSTTSSSYSFNINFSVNQAVNATVNLIKDAIIVQNFSFNETSLPFNFEASFLQDGEFTLELLVFNAVEEYSETLGIITKSSEQTSSQGSGGGGGICYTQWNCTAWSKCVNGIETRSCVKVFPYCVNKTAKPKEIRNCSISSEKNETSNNETKAGIIDSVKNALIKAKENAKTTMGITGAFIGANKTPIAGTIIFIAVIVVTAIVTRIIILKKYNLGKKGYKK